MTSALSLKLSAILVVGLVAVSGGCGSAPADSAKSAPPVALRWNDQPPHPQVEVVGLPEELVDAIAAVTLKRVTADDWNRILALHVVPEVAVGDNSAAATPELPMLGKHVVGVKEPPSLAFRPQFPLRAGTKYRVRFDPAALASLAGMDAAAVNGVPLEVIELEFETPPAAPRPPTTVTAVYPSADVLPENQLKFYIHFSAPMSRGEAYQHVRLEKASGEVVPVPFLELSEELWDSDARRFTLFFEPGRVKRGVMLRDEIGPALVAGQEYALVVDGSWRDANGQPLGNDFRKPFRAGPIDEAQPDPKLWQVTSPPAGTRAPLVVAFNESLDHEMLFRVIRVLDAHGRETPGKIAVDQNETRWQFTPDSPWLPGPHELAVAGILEDLAGNSVGRLFEVKMENKDREVPNEARISFQIAP